MQSKQWKLAAAHSIYDKNYMSCEQSNFSTLTLVATPIGNLGDITVRAVETLNSVNVIACEDTRTTRKLLDKIGIEKSVILLSYREENEKHMALKLADRIQSGEHVALISDAGMPTISDPGFRLVRECRNRGIKVTSAPGQTAATTALALSGLPSNGFLYAGFLPPKSAARKKFLKNKKDFEYTIILYESCHRIEKLLNDIVEVLGKDRYISVSRELTKLHETIHSGTANQVRELIIKGSQKGEFVVCIGKSGFRL